MYVHMCDGGVTTYLYVRVYLYIYIHIYIYIYIYIYIHYCIQHSFGLRGESSGGFLSLKEKQRLSQSATQLLEEAEGHFLAQDGIFGQRAQHLSCHGSSHFFPSLRRFL